MNSDTDIFRSLSEKVFGSRAFQCRTYLRHRLRISPPPPFFFFEDIVYDGFAHRDEV